MVVEITARVHYGTIIKVYYVVCVCVFVFVSRVIVVVDVRLIKEVNLNIMKSLLIYDMLLLSLIVSSYVSLCIIYLLSLIPLCCFCNIKSQGVILSAVVRLRFA